MCQRTLNYIYIYFIVMKCSPKNEKFPSSVENTHTRTNKIKDIMKNCCAVSSCVCLHNESRDPIIPYNLTMINMITLYDEQIKI